MSRRKPLFVHREFNMGLVTGLLICAVTALVLYWAVPLYWSFTRPWDHARSHDAPGSAEAVDGPSDLASWAALRRLTEGGG
jgi:hypothetical protein